MKNIVTGLALTLVLASSALGAPKAACCDGSKRKTACCKVACCSAPCCASAKATLKAAGSTKKADRKVASCCAMPCCNGGACCATACCG